MILAIIIGFMVIGWAIQFRLKRKIKKYSQLPIRSGISGAETAAQMLRDNGIYDVEITCIGGQLTDHYNPVNKTINLSEGSFHGRNAAAVAIAAHETGHAVQHATAYAPLKLRSALVPIQNASSTIINVVAILGFIGAGLFHIFPYSSVLMILIACYGAITLFSFVTLPVEFDASKRALAWINSNGVVSSKEYEMSKDALNWAAMTYVVGALSSLTMLLYYVLQLVGSDD